MAAALMGALAWPPQAGAQMVLPGAVAPTAEGASQAPGPAPKKSGVSSGGPKVARGVSAALPVAAGLIGRTLLHNGNGSQFVLAAGSGKDLSASRIVLVGEKISAPRDSCRIESAAATQVTDLGRPTGLARYRLDYPACPITFEVLEGAVLVSSEPAACTFVEADCRVQAVGLWGPAPSEVGPDRVKQLERARGAAETAMRGNYRALTITTRDRPSVMAAAKEQAQFSSSREETCRDYAEEARHNLCATAVTQGRAAQLQARLQAAVADKQNRKNRHGASTR